MRKKKERGMAAFFEKFAGKVTEWVGHPLAFILAVCTVLIWGITGPVFGFSDTWQLVINTGTTIVTFLMVFLIQQSQNKDSHAIQLKLNEIVAAMKGASNRLINVEDLSEKELLALKDYYTKLADIAAREEDISLSHSVEEAENNQKVKTHYKKASQKKPLEE
jgi:low affinity Fe/Cu permease